MTPPAAPLLRPADVPKAPLQVLAGIAEATQTDHLKSLRAHAAVIKDESGPLPGNRNSGSDSGGNGRSMGKALVSVIHSSRTPEEGEGLTRLQLQVSAVSRKM